MRWRGVLVVVGGYQAVGWAPRAAAARALRTNVGVFFPLRGVRPWVWWNGVGW